ncbi:MAG: hypothetical protein M1829_005673 [Trizodia sp. TS-e1964]|nr:MAG: hypothetical protein M1829_005673 [Trizodia sp. TS-e1964]
MSTSNGGLLTTDSTSPQSITKSSIVRSMSRYRRRAPPPASSSALEPMPVAVAVGQASAEVPPPIPQVPSHHRKKSSSTRSRGLPNGNANTAVGYQDEIPYQLPPITPSASFSRQQSAGMEEVARTQENTWVPPASTYHESSSSDQEYQEFRRLKRKEVERLERELASIEHTMRLEKELEETQRRIRLEKELEDTKRKKRLERELEEAKRAIRMQQELDDANRKKRLERKLQDAKRSLALDKQLEQDNCRLEKELEDLQRYQSSSKGSDDTKGRTGTKRPSKPKPLLDFSNPEFREAPQHLRKGRGFKPAVMPAGGLVDAATTPEAAFYIPPSTTWRRPTHQATGSTSTTSNGNNNTNGMSRSRTVKASAAQDSGYISGAGYTSAPSSAHPHRSHTVRTNTAALPPPGSLASRHRSHTMSSAHAPPDFPPEFTGLLARSRAGQGNSSTGKGVRPAGGAREPGQPLLDVREESRFVQGSLLHQAERREGLGRRAVDRSTEF